MNPETLTQDFMLEWNAIEMNNDIFVLMCFTITVIALTFILSLMESSLLYIDELKVSILKRKNPKKKKVFEAIIKKKKNHLSVMIFLNTIISIMGSTILGALSSAYFESLMVALYSFFLTYFILTISKILPKLLAVNHSLKIFEATAYIIRILYFLTIPMLWTTNIVTFWFTRETNKNSDKHEEEFHAIIDYYKDKGVIHNTEKSVLERVMKMKTKKAKEIFNKTDTIFEIENFKMNANDLNQHYKGEPPRKIFVNYKDNVIGVVYNKDISRSIAYEGGTTKITELMKEPIVISQNENLFEVVHRLNIEEKSVAVVLDEDNKPIGVLTPKVIYRYLLKNVNLLSSIDLDTGVLSRKNFIDKIEKFFDSAKENNEADGSFSIIFLDIKKFSRYNDKYGYHQGDKVLKDISKTIQSTIKDNFIIGRLGEGFGLILDDSNQEKAEKILSNIEENLKVKNIALRKSVTEYSNQFEYFLQMIRQTNLDMKSS